MKKLFIILANLITALGYSQNCECTEYQIEEFKVPAMDTFNFSNGEKLRICPPVKYTFDNDIHDYFKDFKIEDCENDSLIRYWEHLYCKAEFDKDTLKIFETVKLPTGKKRKFIIVNKSITLLYFNSGKTIVSYKELPISKYSVIEIEAVLKEYDNAIKRKKMNAEYLYSSLLVALLSGNDNAQNFFLNFEENLGDIMTDPEKEHYRDLKSAFFEDW